MQTTSRIPGFDAYHGDGEINFNATKNAGNVFCFLKSTEGAWHVDALFAHNRSAAHAAQLIVGAYHFFDDSDPIQQAKHFLAVAKPTAGELVLTLDVETYFDGVADAAHTAAQYIKTETGRWPILYSGQSFYEDHLAAKFPANMHTLWIARYGAAPTVSPISFWQYTEKGKLAGHTGDVDLNWFYGTLDQLKSHCV